MVKITVHHLKPDEIVSIVRALKNDGLIQGSDFDFEYHAATFQTGPEGGAIPRHTVFTFYEDKNATLFALKWCHNV